MNLMLVSAEEKNAFKDLYKIDFYRITVLHSPIREKIFTFLRSFRILDKIPPLIDLSDRIIKNTFGKIITVNYSYENLLNLSFLRSNIKEIYSVIYIYAPYNYADTSIMTLTKEQEFIINLLSSDHGLKYKSLTNAFRKFFKNSEYGKYISDGYLYSLLKDLYKRDIIKIVKGRKTWKK
jgi:hypothetical protein